MSELIEWMQNAKQRIWQSDLLIKNPSERNWYCQGYEDAMRHAIEHIRQGGV